MSQPFLDGYSQPQCLKALMIPWSVLAVETKSAMALRSSIAFPIAVAWSTARVDGGHLGHRQNHKFHL